MFEEPHPWESETMVTGGAFGVSIGCNPTIFPTRLTSAGKRKVRSSTGGGPGTLPGQPTSPTCIQNFGVRL
jgi:hypothetical protein